MQAGCCELAKHNLKKLSHCRFRGDRCTGDSSLGSRLLLFSTIMQRNFWRGGTFLLFSSSPIKPRAPYKERGRLREGAL